MEIKLATWINAGERCTNQEEFIELKIFALAILESKIRTWVNSTWAAVAPHQGTETHSYLVIGQTWYTIIFSVVSMLMLCLLYLLVTMMMTNL
jgi:hypothetical protein